MTQFAIVIDPITDDAETADSCIVRCAGTEIYIDDYTVVRALYDCPSAESYGDGSYMISVEDFDEIIGEAL